MIGGLFKSASRLALVATAGILAGSVAAQAADLGGDCCADLEERVAELEATTVRKGNRKVSLQLSGQVHESIMFWDDGKEQNVYVGANHINSSSRFRFVGEAKITPDWSAGYLMEIETQAKSDTNDMNQNDQNNGSGTGVVVRHNAWWIDSKSMGRIWLGLTDAATAGIVGINLANTGNVANVKAGLQMSSFILRRKSNDALASAFSGVSGNSDSRTWANLMGGNNMLVGLGNETRNNVIKYVSPTLMGFIFSTSYGEDDFWDVALRYAGEFSGFKVAAGIGYAKTTDSNVNVVTRAGGNPDFPVTNASRTSNASNHFSGCSDNLEIGAKNDRECSSLDIGASIMHVPTGLFLTGSYGRREDELRHLRAAGYVGWAKDDVQWDVRGGIEQNWTGLGKTTLYGEYVHYEGTPMRTGGTGGRVGLSDVNGVFGGDVVRSEVAVWGLGLVQAIDAAAMDLYIGYRNYSADVTIDSNGSTAGGAAVKGNALHDFQTINAGGIIRF